MTQRKLDEIPGHVVKALRVEFGPDASGASAAPRIIDVELQVSSEEPNSFDLIAKTHVFDGTPISEWRLDLRLADGQEVEEMRGKIGAHGFNPPRGEYGLTVSFSFGAQIPNLARLLGASVIRLCGADGLGRQFQYPKSGVIPLRMSQAKLLPRAAYTVPILPSDDTLAAAIAEQDDSSPPKLTITHVEYVHDDDQPEIRFTIVNLGGSIASIGESSVRSWIRTKGEALPAIPPYAGPPIELPGELPSGGERRITFRDPTEKLDLMVGHVQPDVLETFLLGHIRYTEASGGAHHLGFCRRRLERSSRFEAIADTEYEYSH